MALAVTEIDANSGTVTLSDGTRWQVAPGDLTTIATWLPMHRVSLKGTGVTRELVNKDHGSAASVTLAD